MRPSAVMKLHLLALLLGLGGLASGAAQLLAGDSDGLQRSYFSNGNLKESAAFEGDRRHGACRRWYADGAPRSEGEFEGGVRVGAWTFWTETGEVDRERSGFYVAGRRQEG